MKKSIQLVFFFIFTVCSLEVYSRQSAAVPVGVFKFRNRVELLTIKKSEMVNSLTQTGKKRIFELKALGWTCQQQAGNLNKCTVFEKNERLPSELLSKIQKKYNDFAIYFSEIHSSALTNDSEFLKEYDVAQLVELNHLSLDKYLLQVLKDGPIKLQFKLKENEKFYLNLIDENTNAAFETYTIAENNKSTLYAVEIIFEK